MGGGAEAAAQWRMVDSWLVFKCADGNDDASPTLTGCVLLFCLSEVDVRLLIEEPRATAVKKNKTKQKKTAQCSRNLCCPFSEMQFELFFFF